MKFMVIEDRVIDNDLKTKKGDIVYSCRMPDYGLSSDDTFMTGIEHISVTHNENGEYPFFTIPRKDLENIGE